MKNVFQHSGKTFNRVFFLSAKYVDGRCGVLDIYEANQVKLTPKSGERVHFTAVGGKHFAAAQEPTDMEPRHRETPPYNRTSPYTYIGYGWDSLDIVPTSDGSRFLALKNAWNNGETFSSVDDDYIAVLCDNKGDLGRQLDNVLPKIGVPHADVAKVKAHILNKFN